MAKRNLPDARILGIETSCDETAAAVIENGRSLLSNVVASQIDLHARYGGVFPEVASRQHIKTIYAVVSEALEQAHMQLNNLDAIAVTRGPGLAGSLVVGINMAKGMAVASGLPLIGVNHVLGHLYSAFLDDRVKMKFPFVGLVVSGGHTALFYCKSVNKQELLGQTQDDAVGEAYDKVAKILGLGYPGGPVIEERALDAKGHNGITFPKSYMGKDSLDFSFSGVKTAVLYYVRDRFNLRGGKIPPRRWNRLADICYAFQEAVLDVLVDKAMLAAEKCNVDRIVVGGGVAINSRLREKFSEYAAMAGKEVYFPEKRYCLDNAAMIGSLGEAFYKKGYRSDLYLSAQPNLEVKDG